MSFNQRSLIHREAWFSPFFVRQNQPKKTFFFGDFRPLSNKNVQIWDHFFPFFFPKNSESLKILDIWLREVGAKRRLNGTSKVNRHTDTQTDRQTDISTYRKHRPRGPMLWKQNSAHSNNKLNPYRGMFSVENCVVTPDLRWKPLSV